MPKGVTKSGWPAVKAKCAELGVAFRPWQEGAGKLILAKRADGTYASTIGGTGMSIPRQVGKTFLVAAIVFALCLLRPNLTVIWTAHRLRTAEETFGKLQAFAKRAKIRPFVEKIVLGSGEEEIRFVNGSRILFGARERGFGRGFDEVDVVIFDEAQILGDSALDDMIPATNQSRQDSGVLMLFMGTPPKPTDNSEAFTRMRTEALSGEDDDTAWIEFGADPKFVPTPLPAPLEDRDWEQVAKANPSFPEDTSRAAILRMRKKLGQASFGREGLGIWDEFDVKSIWDRDAQLPRWSGSATDMPRPEVPQTIGLAVSLDREWGSIAAATLLDSVLPVDAGPDDLPREPVYVAAVERRRGTAWLATEAKRIQDKYPDLLVVVDEKGPTKDLIRDLEDADVAFETMSLDESAEACSLFYDKLGRGEVLHPQRDEDAVDELDTAFLAAEWRFVDGRRLLDRRRAAGHIDMGEAAVNAVFAAARLGSFNIF